jgi:ParB-like chromosome segregation protein Spo0J
LFPALPSDVAAALRASIRRFGVIVPVVVDQHGAFLDGHHRAAIADELGVSYERQVHRCADDDERRAIARTLNADRRHLTADQRKEIVAVLAAETVAGGPGGREEVARHSPEAIATALGVSKKTVQDDIEELATTSQLRRPAKTLGRDNKVRPTARIRKEETDVSAMAEPRKSGPGRKSRQPLPEQAKQVAWALRKDVEKIEKVFADDRFGENKERVAAHMRGHLTYAVETLGSLLGRISQEGV